MDSPRLAAAHAEQYPATREVVVVTWSLALVVACQPSEPQSDAGQPTPEPTPDPTTDPDTLVDSATSADTGTTTTLAQESPTCSTLPAECDLEVFWPTFSCETEATGCDCVSENEELNDAEGNWVLAGDELTLIGAGTFTVCTGGSGMAFDGEDGRILLERG